MIRINNVDLDEDYESVVRHLEIVFKKRANEFGIEIKNYRGSISPLSPPYSGGEIPIIGVNEKL